MWRAPQFWDDSGDRLIPRLLAPVSEVVATVTARRAARPGWRAPVPVICCGNLTVGGTGKTTLALDLAKRLQVRGVAAHVLIRGYGGNARRVRRVVPGDPVALTGDEALLLAETATTWIGSDRAASARAAIGAGAAALIMDDGLQNPSLQKDLSLLVVDGGVGFGNGRVLPAGPLREKLAMAVPRCTAAVLIGEDRKNIVPLLSPLPVLRARLLPDPEVAALVGKPVLAFTGIGRPGKFFETLKQSGVVVADSRSFPDHHIFSERELRRLLSDAERIGAQPVTTAKDAVRLPTRVRAEIFVARIHLAWDTLEAIETLLDRVVRRL